MNIKGSIFDCCATYIKEEYLNLDDEVPETEEPKVDMKFNLCDDNESAYEGTLNFAEIMNHLSKERATTYNDWFYIGVSLINLYYRKILTRGMVYDLFDSFSSKADNYDTNGVYKVIDSNIARFDGKGYGIKYLLECLKIDDYEYYKLITLTIMNITN
jgi:hypothetical protein